AAAAPLASAGAAGRSAARPPPLPGALSGVERPPLLQLGPPGARRDALLHLREDRPPRGGAGAQAPGTGPPSPAARAAPLRRRAPAPGRQPPPVAGPGAGAMAHAA